MVCPSPVMVWRPDQLGAFLDSAGSDRLYALYHLVSYRGLRRGESAGLAWADVDLDGAAVTVRRQRVLIGWDVIEGDPKSVAGERTGEPLHPATISDRFHDLVVAADLPPVRLHDLRHGAASIMLAAGVDLKVVQETLRHSSITLTSDTYTSVYPAVAADAAAAMVARAVGADVVTPLSRPGSDVHPHTESRRSDGAPGETRTPNLLIRSAKFTS